jgi:hypothetical protein
LSAVSGESMKERAAEADVAQLAERVLGKDEVTSSILVIGSSLRSPFASFGEARESRDAKADRRRNDYSNAVTETTCE